MTCPHGTGPRNLACRRLTGSFIFPQVTSFKGSEEFFYKVKADDKEFKPFQVQQQRLHVKATARLIHKSL